MYRLDKTYGKGHKHENAEKDSDYWRTKTVDERLRAVMYLNSIAWHFDPENPPRIDKTVFSMRKHKIR